MRKKDLIKEKSLLFADGYISNTCDFLIGLRRNKFTQSLTEKTVTAEKLLNFNRSKSCQEHGTKR